MHDDVGISADPGPSQMSTNNRAPNLALQPAECILPSMCCNRFPNCHCRTEASRDRILRDLQSESEADLSGSHRRFIPRGRLLRILDRQRVADHLATLLDDRRLLEKLSSYTSPEKGETCHCQDSLCTGSRIILASLLRIGREDLIENLYNQSDRRVEPGNQTFEELDEAALPFLRVDEGENPIIGEFTIVRRIKIDPDHHNLGGNGDCFALKTFQKRLYRLGEDKFRDEFIANQQTPWHNRIVPVLAAFKHRQEFHFIFPYADDGNLEEFWKTYSSIEPTTWYSPQWLLGECLGIAESLAAIHQPTVTTEHGTQHIWVPRLHADIKPRNILCFGTIKEGHRSFTLKLADFGVSREVNGNSTLEVGHVTHTRTYRPPEYDLEEIVNLNYDVWCLGCVYLEFLIWAVLGWSEVDNFGRTRMNETDDPHTSAVRGLDYEDTFFRKAAHAPRPYSVSGLKFRIERRTEITSKKSTTSQRLFRIDRGNTRISCEVKNSVKSHINTIRNHERCIPEFRKFLNFIETRMLVIDAGTRASSNEVKIFIRDITNTRLNEV
ncbi:hypothetical protein CHU98_g4761 [Xylaria longipes]|nr:hypothetical protein CHU98_g4761 [Xylaria longipes]